jgi:uncharacterized SAM-binding protein YcdF (DUF218 family)
VLDAVIQFIKDYLIPGSSTFLIIGVAIGVILLYTKDRWAKAGKVGLSALILFYWIISTPMGAIVLEAGLSRKTEAIETQDQAQGAEAIVVLGGGSINLRSRGEVFSLLISASALRAMEGIRLYELMDEPLVIVSGGSNPFLGGGTPESILLLDMMMDAGIPGDKIILETDSRSTREQAQKIKPLLEDRNIDTFILVTSPIHMGRSMAVFKAHGMEPIASPSALRSEGFDGKIGILPSWIALDASQSAFREYMAIGYYWIRGWLSSP